MKIFRSSLSAASLALLIVQVLLVSSVAAKYEYQRWRCPRVWTRAGGYDPELLLRGRYLSLQLNVHGCQSTLPSAKQALFPRDVSGAAIPGPFFVRRFPQVQFRADLKVQNNSLAAIRIQEPEREPAGQMVDAWAGQSCQAMTLDSPVYFYISEKAPRIFPLKAKQELWIEVTVPPKGPPRPLQLALKENGLWKPLAFE